MDLSTIFMAMAIAVAINVATAVAIDVAKGMAIDLAVIADIATDIGSICVDVVKGVAVAATMAIDSVINNVIDIIRDISGGVVVAITITIDIIKCVAIFISRGTTIAIVVVVAIFDGVAAAIVVAVGIVMGVVIGATVLWVIVAPICRPKTEESSTAGESGMYVCSFFAGDADHLWLKRRNPSFLGFDINIAACKRLVKRAFTSHELLSLVETVSSNKDERDIVRSPHRDDAQLSLTSRTRRWTNSIPHHKSERNASNLCTRYAVATPSSRNPFTSLLATTDRAFRCTKAGSQTCGRENIRVGKSPSKF